MAAGYEPVDIFWDGIVLLLVNIVLWLVSIPLGKTWPVDAIWSNFPIYQSASVYIRDHGRGNRDRQVLVLCLVCLWGFRLTLNFVARGGIGSEDWRYANMRARFGPRHFWWVSLFSVFLGQSVFLFGASLSLYGALTKPTPLVGRDWIAFGITLGSILLEAISDIQMDRFINQKKEKRTDKVIIDTGLWNWSRHPNYMGEILFWWGLYLFSYSDNDGDNNYWWVVLGPVALTLLIAVVSIKMMEDRQLAKKKQDFVAYRRRVGSALLLLPPFVNRKLGRCLYGSGDDSNDGNQDNNDGQEEPGNDVEEQSL